jgi:hypothetical protein
LGDRPQIAVAHAGLDGRHHLGEEGVLHRGGRAQQRDLLRALDRLDPVDQVAGIDQRGGDAVADGIHKAARQRAAPYQPDRLVAALLELGGDQDRIVFVRIGD